MCHIWPTADEQEAVTAVMTGPTAMVDGSTWQHKGTPCSVGRDRHPLQQVQCLRRPQTCSQWGLGWVVRRVRRGDFDDPYS